MRLAKEIQQTKLHSQIPSIFCVLAIISVLVIAMSVPKNSYAQPPVPLLLGENRDNKGKQQPLPPTITEILSYIEKDSAIKFNHKPYPWNRAVMMANYYGDLIFALSITNERKKTFHFSDPVFYNTIWLVTLSDHTFPYASMQDLKGKKIGVIRGSKYGEEFDQQKNKLFTVEDDVNAYAPRLKKLAGHRMDAMLFASQETDAKMVEAQVNRILEAETSGTNSHKKTHFSVLPTPLLRDAIRFAIRSDRDHGIIQKLNETIERGNKSKVFEKIISENSLH